MTNSTVNKNENTLQSQIEDIEFKLYALRLQCYNLEKQQEQIELDPDDYEDQFDDLLDESGTVEAGGYSFYPSRILKELDPVAYSCSLNDYADSVFDALETDEYKALQEEIDQLQSDIEDLENEIEDLESEIADLTE